jgi:hypothetical protein
MSLSHSFWRKSARLLAGGLIDPPESGQHDADQEAFKTGIGQAEDEPASGNISIQIGLIAMMAVALTGALNDSEFKRMLQGEKYALTSDLNILASNLGLDEDH